jgi:hypothetical protein
MNTEQQTLKMWACVSREFTKNPFYVAYDTIAWRRSDSIKKHIHGGVWTWRKWKSKGWTCERVLVVISPIQIPTK